jgi:hypothetical protein
MVGFRSGGCDLLAQGGAARVQRVAVTGGFWGAVLGTGCGNQTWVVTRSALGEWFSPVKMRFRTTKVCFVLRVQRRGDADPSQRWVRFVKSSYLLKSSRANCVSRNRPSRTVCPSVALGSFCKSPLVLVQMEPFPSWAPLCDKGRSQTRFVTTGDNPGAAQNPLSPMVTSERQHRFGRGLATPAKVVQFDL